MSSIVLFRMHFIDYSDIINITTIIYWIYKGKHEQPRTAPFTSRVSAESLSVSYFFYLAGWLRDF